ASVPPKSNSSALTSRKPEDRDFGCDGTDDEPRWPMLRALYSRPTILLAVKTASPKAPTDLPHGAACTAAEPQAPSGSNSTTPGCPSPGKRTCPVASLLGEKIRFFWFFSLWSFTE